MCPTPSIESLRLGFSTGEGCDVLFGLVWFCFGFAREGKKILCNKLASRCGVVWWVFSFRSSTSSSSSSSYSTQSARMTERIAPVERHSFVHEGETIYEWDQTLEEVNLYISLPDRLPSRLLYCTIKPQHVELGVKGNPPYLNHDLGGPVKVDSSFWTIEDRIMHVTLQKRQKGQPWPSAIAGHGNLDAFTADQEQRRLMLERFQEEHPGFDFSQAQFTGNVPNPSTFLGGIKQ